jgi:hypothetical protein
VERRSVDRATEQNILQNSVPLTGHFRLDCRCLCARMALTACRRPNILGFFPILISSRRNTMGSISSHHILFKNANLLAFEVSKSGNCSNFPGKKSLRNDVRIFMNEFYQQCNSCPVCLDQSSVGIAIAFQARHWDSFSDHSNDIFLCIEWQLHPSNINCPHCPQVVTVIPRCRRQRPKPC